MSLDTTFKKNTKRSFKLVRNDVDQFKERMDQWMLYLMHRVEELEKEVRKNRKK